MSHPSNRFQSTTSTSTIHENSNSHTGENNDDEFQGKLIQASVLVIDFHEATGQLTTEMASTTLEELSVFYTVMQRVVLEQGGRVSRRNKNGFLALFGASLPSLTHAQQATNVAMELLTRLGRINGRRVERGDAPLRIGFGVSSGEMIVGHVTPHQQHRESVLGHTVETAVALSHVNKRAPVPTVFVASETAAALRPRHNWYLANLGAVCNNGSGPLDVHALVLLAG